MIGHEQRYIDPINRITPLNNKVLVKIDFDPENDTTESGLVKGSAKWDEAGHVVRYGTVVSTPKKLLEREIYAFGIEWGTEIEVQAGDTVYFGKMAGYNSEVVKINGDIHFLVDYSELILRIREERIYPLNGFILLDKVTDFHGEGKISISFLTKDDKKRGIVKYVGRMNDYYFPVKNDYVEATDINEGDEVIFSIAGFTELEDSRYAKLQAMGYMQRRWIIGKIEHDYEFVNWRQHRNKFSREDKFSWDDKQLEGGRTWYL